MKNFTTYIGAHQRWIEVRRIRIPAIPDDGIWNELTCEFIIYSNEMRNKIDELKPEHHQDKSILGNFFYFFGDNISEFKGREILRDGELSDMAYAIKSSIIFHYGASLGMKVTNESV